MPVLKQHALSILKMQLIHDHSAPDSSLKSTTSISSSFSSSSFLQPTPFLFNPTALSRLTLFASYLLSKKKDGRIAQEYGTGRVE